MKKIIPPLIFLLFLLSSCMETKGRGNLQIILNQKVSAKTIKPDDRSSTVVKYNVKGVGPSGKTFSKDSSSKTIVVDGITMGTWTVTATGYNSDSAAIVSGSKTFDFNKSTKAVYIDLNSFAGTGTLQVEFDWDSEITNPVLKLCIEKEGFSVSETYSPGDKQNSYKYLKSGLEAGSYRLHADLYNGSTHILGTVEAVQIVNNKTSQSSISLISPTGTKNDSDTLYIIDRGGYPITGHISLSGYSKLPTVMEAGKQQTFKLVLDSSRTATADLVCTWFLDGNQIGTGMEINAVPEVGNHIMNVLVSCGNNTESIFYRFGAKVSAKKGSATLLNKIAKTSNSVVLASDTLIGALPDNHFILITPSRSSMQVVSAVDNNLAVTANQTYNATDFRFTWLSQVTGVYSNPNMNFAALRTGTDGIKLIQFNPKTGKLDVALWNEEPLELSGFTSMPPAFLDDITTVAMLPSSESGGTFFIFDSGERSKEMIGIETSGTDVQSLNTSVRDDDMKSHICSDARGNLLGVITANGALRYAKVQNGFTTSEWMTHEDDNMADINEMRFLNSRFAAFRSPSKLFIYEYYAQQKYWVLRTTRDIASGSFDVSLDGAYIYIADNEGNLLTYRSGLTDNFGKINSQKTESNLTFVVSNTNSVLGRDSDGNLYLFDIAQEDSSL